MNLLSKQQSLPVCWFRCGQRRQNLRLTLEKDDLADRHSQSAMQRHHRFTCKPHTLWIVFADGRHAPSLQILIPVPRGSQGLLHIRHGLGYLSSALDAPRRQPACYCRIGDSRRWGNVVKRDRYAAQLVVPGMVRRVSATDTLGCFRHQHGCSTRHRFAQAGTFTPLMPFISTSIPLPHPVPLFRPPS